MMTSGFEPSALDRKSTRLNSSHLVISYAVFCLKKKTFEIGTTLAALELRLLRQQLRHPKGDKSLAAQLLGLSTRTIYRNLVFFFFLSDGAPADFSPFPLRRSLRT